MKLMGRRGDGTRRHLNAPPPGLTTSDAAQHRPDWENTSGLRQSYVWRYPDADAAIQWRNARLFTSRLY
jgi:hypothetical protein